MGMDNATTARNEYKALATEAMKKHGVTAERFNDACSGLLMELCDEREIPRTPEWWVRAAKEVLHYGC